MIGVKRGMAVLLSLGLAASTVAAPALAPLAEPQGERVRISGRAVAESKNLLAGRGIEGIDSRPVVDHAGRELVWKQVRQHVDQQGNVHKFFRQYLAGEGITAEVYGSEVAAHYTAGGKLWSVNGMQFRNVTVANGVSLDREAAIDAAAFRVLSRGTRVRKLDDLPTEVRERSLNAAKLMLVQADGVFRYTYFTYASDADDVGYQIVVDADDERILAMTQTNMGGNCLPTGSLVTVNATGTPVRPGPANRVIKAHPATDRPAPYTHEGYWHSLPYKTVYQQVTGSATWMCNGALSYSWTIVPLKTDSGVVVYKDWPGEQWLGSAAGDAIYHSDLTNRYFKFIHGRNSWDDNNGPIKIIVAAVTPAKDQAQYNMNVTSIAPPNSVMLGLPGRMYNAAASLDWVAHEWGHGVIDTSADFPYSGVGAELHEGFADVIGNMVERYYHPAGSGLETADWTMHEDSAVSGYVRGAIDDNTGHIWKGPNVISGTDSYSFNDLLHASDTPAPTGPALVHARGNMLSVVQRLLAEGGFNPVCGRLGTLSGCTTNVPSLGISKTNRILFTALESTLPSNSNWSTLADSVADAAFALYNGCSGNPLANAATEQHAVFDAFRAIGYPSATEALNNCP
ncbi:MAG: bacillolysin [Acidobacteriota bacterium]|jgi:Zn-dependent metalloprotease|nr:bacillolysin [Acidobacteriota bacterium]